ncbi:MAG: hypothetical protein HY646_10275 [Acidobacteria bacterium]|nr:hypothetical protein [Acidobacteriota bacterium]
MRSVAIKFVCLSAGLLVVVAVIQGGSRAEGARGGSAQERSVLTNDPRVGLKPGFRDAGVAARNMELVVNLPKPEGFFDAKSPAGIPSSPEPPPGDRGARGGRGGEGNPPAAEGQRGAQQAGGGGGSGLNFANSDLAFARDHVIMGSYHGFNTYNIEDPRRARLLASVVCPGGQGDVSIFGNLLFMSVEQTRARVDCGTQGVEAPVSPERFRGIRIFDISDLKKPRQIAAIQTCRGSHTHTLVTKPGDTANLYVYGSGTGAVRSGEELTGCSGADPKEDPNTALFSIDVIQVPLAAPHTAKIVNRPRIFADPATGNIAGLWQGGDHGPGTQSSRITQQCHDITVFPAVGLAAGACAGNGILLDISDPVNPVRLDHVVDKAFAYWHSATFNNDGTKVVFTDEWGGGTRPRCRATDPIAWGGNAIFDIVDRKLQFRSYYKMAAAQTEQENCVAHNGSLIPIPGRDLMVQGWYQGGVSVFDFTDSANPVEIAYFDRGPIDPKDLYTGGYWSAYWYNGHIYGSEIARGIDVFRLKPSEFLSQNEIDAAALAETNEFNPQHQPRVVWPPNSVVARAYIDQLNRTKRIQPARAKAVTDALGRIDKIRSKRDRNAAAVVREIDGLIAQLETDAAAATGRDAMRLKSLAETLKGRIAALR